MRIGIALGSNLGDRIQHLRRAKNLLLQIHEGGDPFLTSKIYETQPVACPPGSPLFLNAAIELTASTPPLELLTILQAFEASLGRPAEHPANSPRTIDLDILYCDQLTLSLDTLTLPHSGISQRSFVLRPLMDICPERILPNQDRTICELSELLKEREFCDGGCKIYATNL